MPNLLFFLCFTDQTSQQGRGQFIRDPELLGRCHAWCRCTAPSIPPYKQGIPFYVTTSSEHQEEVCFSNGLSL